MAFDFILYRNKLKYHQYCRKLCGTNILKVYCSSEGHKEDLSLNQVEEAIWPLFSQFSAWKPFFSFPSKRGIKLIWRK